MTEHDQILSEQVLTLVDESAPTVTADAVLARSAARRRSISGGIRVGRRNRLALTIAWSIAVVILLVAAAIGFKAASSSNPAPVTPVHKGNGHPRTAPNTKVTVKPPTPAPTTTTPSTTEPPTTVPTHASTNVVQSVSWVGASVGFVLSEQAGCSADSCEELLKTTDGGSSWQVLPALPSCGSGCQVTQVSFVNDNDGYAIGETSYLTTDGGATWTQASADYISSVMSVGDRVLAVTYTHTGCPGPCGVQVQSATLGTTDWHPVTSSFEADQMRTAVSGSNIYVALLQNPAGGSGDAHATLLISNDAGASFSQIPDPCGDPGGNEADTQKIAAGPGSDFEVLCADRTSPNTAFVLSSSNGGKSFDQLPALPQDLESSMLWSQVAITPAGTTLIGGYSADGGYSVWSNQAGSSTWNDLGTFATTNDVNQLDDFADYSIYFSSTQVGWWGQPSTYLLETSDGGLQWSRVPIDITSPG